jgi:hypothetical protein
MQIMHKSNNRKINARRSPMNHPAVIILSSSVGIATTSEN